MGAFGRLTAGLAAGLLAGIVLAAPVGAQDAVTFATPEDAVAAYLQGVKDADAAEILGASAVDQMAAGVAFAAYIDRIQAWTMQAPAPATDPFLSDLTLAQQQGMLLGQVRNLVYGMLTDIDLSGGIVSPVDAAWAEALIDQLDMERLAGLAVGEVVLPNPELMAGDRYRESVAKQAAIWGADEMTERVATVTLDGTDWLVGFTLLRYGDDWRVAYQSSPIAGTPSTGAPMPVEE